MDRQAGVEARARRREGRTAPAGVRDQGMGHPGRALQHVVEAGGDQGQEADRGDEGLQLPAAQGPAELGGGDQPHHRRGQGRDGQGHHQALGPDVVGEPARPGDHRAHRQGHQGARLHHLDPVDGPPDEGQHPRAQGVQQAQHPGDDQGHGHGPADPAHPAVRRDPLGQGGGAAPPADGQGRGVRPRFASGGPCPLAKFRRRFMHLRWRVLIGGARVGTSTRPLPDRTRP